jgi:signal transduction histidine kinase
MLDQLEKMHSAVAQCKEISLVFQPPGDESSPILLDVKLFHRVLDNLLANAVKFSPTQSKVTVRFEYLKGPVPSLRVQVMDEGPGIPQEQRELIFNKFSVVELKQQGISQFGFGLAFCKTVVEAHGGRIFVTDNKPQGSILTIEI